MKKIILASFIVGSLGLMALPALADSNVTIQVRNASSTPVNYTGSNCTSATCPTSFPSPITAGATSPGFTATSISGNTAMMRVDYGNCRFTAQTSKRVGFTGCEPPITTAFATSSGPKCSVVLPAIQNPTTCDLSVTFIFGQ